VKKLELVVYNSNNPDLFTVLHSDGCSLNLEQFEIIETACKGGPYLAFFNGQDLAHIYRLRGPYQGYVKFYILDRTGLVVDDDQANIMDNIFTRIAEIKDNF
jgi:hypothetical protein